MRWVRVMLALVVVLVAAPACTKSKNGVEAYKQGDYATALKEVRPLAERGDAAAQYNLGVMYREGRGVPQDDVQAHMWFNLAAAQGHEGARKFRDNVLAERMTRAQVAEAQRFAREWKPKKE